MASIALAAGRGGAAQKSAWAMSKDAVRYCVSS
jgi:hypothetical protein